MNASNYKSPLHEMTCTTPTDLWNDSCSIEELNYAIEHGAVGATTNPVIVGEVLKKEMPVWADHIDDIIRNNPHETEDTIAWQVIEAMAVKGAEILKPVYDRENGLKGRISIQTNPKYHCRTEAIVEQAVHFDTLAPNMQIKIPVTKAGVAAIEEVTYRGVNVNATVSFCVPQAIAVAEAIERGLTRRKALGHDVSKMRPVCTIMVGRIDDWLRVVAERDSITTDPGYLNWAGVAIVKEAYRLYQERGYRTRLLAAAYRCHMHWSELIGGDLVVSIPYGWQKKFNSSTITCEPRMDRPVEPRILDGLNLFPDFQRAFQADGMTVDEFDTFGPTLRTLRQFLGGYDSLVAMLRDRRLPNPDGKK